MFVEQPLQSVNSHFQGYTDWSEKSFLNRYLSVPVGNSTMLRVAEQLLYCLILQSWTDYTHKLKHEQVILINYW